MESSVDGYFLYGVDNEMLMVIRGFDDEIMQKIIDKLNKSRDKDLKALGSKLEDHFSERQDDSRRAVKAKPEDKKEGSGSIGSYNREGEDTLCGDESSP
jgi:hypothetical protein